jgi:transposase-like protein
MGTYIGKMSVDRPYCESCGSWFNDPFTAVRVPRAFSEPIARAIEADDVPAVASLIHQAHQERRIDMATAEAFRCPKCRRTLVRVRNDQAKLKRRDPSLGVLHYVSDEMMQALRANPVMEVEEQPATSSAVAEG